MNISNIELEARVMNVNGARPQRCIFAATLAYTRMYDWYELITAIVPLQHVYIEQKSFESEDNQSAECWIYLRELFSLLTRVWVGHLYAIVKYIIIEDEWKTTICISATRVCRFILHCRVLFALPRVCGRPLNIDLDWISWPANELRWLKRCVELWISMQCVRRANWNESQPTGLYRLVCTIKVTQHLLGLQLNTRIVDQSLCSTVNLHRVRSDWRSTRCESMNVLSLQVMISGLAWSKEQQQFRPPFYG